MEWWAWIVLGAVLLAAELFVPTDFFLAVLGGAALLVAAGTGVGILPGATFQWAAYGMLSLVLIVGARKAFRDRFGPGQLRTSSSELVGEIATGQGRIASGADGKVMLRGTTWAAHNLGDVDVQDGDRVEVVGVDRLTVQVIKRG